MASSGIFINRYDWPEVVSLVNGITAAIWRVALLIPFIARREARHLALFRKILIYAMVSTSAKKRSSPIKP